MILWKKHCDWYFCWFFGGEGLSGTFSFSFTLLRSSSSRESLSCEGSVCRIGFLWPGTVKGFPRTWTRPCCLCRWSSMLSFQALQPERWVFFFEMVLKGYTTLFLIQLNPLNAITDKIDNQMTSIAKSNKKH